MRNLIITAFITSLLSTASFAAIKCDASKGSFGNINCQNTDEDNLTSVIIKRMPRWSINSGLRLIMICNEGGKRKLSGKNYDGLGRVLEEVVGEDYVNREARNEYGVQCVRRFCTEDIENKGLLINGVFLPIPGPVGISTKFSFYQKSIQIDCKPVKYDSTF